jgi:predicted aspartyl protease
MIIPGEWQRLEGGALRPTVKVRVQARDGNFIERHFLVDTGADRTVLCRATLSALPTVEVPETGGMVGGIGGVAGATLVDVTLIFHKDDGSNASVGGPYVAFLAPDASDEDILGRDVLNNFDVVTSFRRREVLLLAPPHSASVAVA